MFHLFMNVYRLCICCNLNIFQHHVAVSMFPRVQFSLDHFLMQVPFSHILLLCLLTISVSLFLEAASFVKKFRSFTNLLLIQKSLDLHIDQQNITKKHSGKMSSVIFKPLIYSAPAAAQSRGTDSPSWLAPWLQAT